MDSSKRLVLKLGIDNPLVASYLAHCITRNPLDLRAHTQRIYLFYSCNNRSGLYSALLDLFIALNDKGTALRQLLLNHSRNKLTPEQIGFFESCLETGLHPNSVIENPDNSLLHSGIESSLPLISKQHISQENTHTDPIKEAQECLEYGQLDLALDILEDAMDKAPQDTLVSDELLQIYILARATDRYQNMTKKIVQSGRDLPPNWVLLNE